MKLSMLLGVTFGCAVLGWLTGCVIALIWLHPLVTFVLFLIVTLASLRLHVPHGRVAGAAVGSVCATVP